jgi:DNA-binding MarR family transcriptional regulator
MNDASPPSIDRFYSAFQKVQQVLRQQLQQHLNVNGGLPLTRGQFYLLRHLFRHGALTIGDLSVWMNVKPATMSTIVDRLEKHGLISRCKNEQDRRMVHVELTNRGTSFIEAIEASWRETLAGKLSHMSAEEQWMIVALLEKLAGGPGAYMEKE